jgi:hypothetical protein
MAEFTISPYDPLAIDLGMDWPNTIPPLTVRREIERRLVALGAEPKGRVGGCYDRRTHKSTFWNIPYVTTGRGE